MNREHWQADDTKQLRTTDHERPFDSTPDSGTFADIDPPPVPRYDPPDDRPPTEPKVFWTYLFLGIIIAVWFALEFTGGSNNPRTLLRWGAQQNSLIWQGQYWRLVTPIFLHIGGAHLALNSWALFILGRDVERLYGPARFLAIFLLSGLGGNVAYLLLSGSPIISAGASGAIFGLFGALIFFGFLLPPERRKHFWPAIAAPVAINIAYGFMNPQINNYAHLGGLAIGWLTALALGLPHERGGRLRRLLGRLALIALAIAAFLVGPTLQQNDWGYSFDRGVRAYEEGDYDMARRYFERVIELEPDAAAAHYNLALVYVHLEQWDKALHHVETAQRLDPSLADAASLQREIERHINSE